MKTKKLLIIPMVITAMLAFLLVGCDDSGNAPTSSTTGNGYIPTMRMHQGARYTYTNDSLINNNGNITRTRTRVGTYDVVNAPITLDNYLCFPILSTSVDTAHGMSTTQVTLFVRYDSTAGKVYQYGVQQLINPTIQPQWDVVADFSVDRGTEWSIGTIYDTLTLPSPVGTVVISGPLTGKVADSTTITTTSPTPTTVHCYRIELLASVSGTALGQPVTASIYIDYYLGYYDAQFANNPSGIVEIKTRPFSIDVSGIPVLYESGFDRVLMNYTP